MSKKKLIAILTLMCFMFTLMPVAAFADTGNYGTMYTERGYTFTINGVKITEDGYYTLDGTKVDSETDAAIQVTDVAKRKLKAVNGATNPQISQVYEREHTDWEKEAVGVYVAGEKITQTGYYSNDGTAVSDSGPIHVDMESKKITLNGATINQTTAAMTLLEDVQDPVYYSQNPQYITDVYDGVNGVKGVLVITEGTYRIHGSGVGGYNWDSYYYWPIGYNKDYQFGSIALGIMKDDETNTSMEDWTLELQGENTITVDNAFAMPQQLPSNGTSHLLDAPAYGVFAESNLTITGTGSLKTEVNNNWNILEAGYMNYGNPNTAAGIWTNGNLVISSGSVEASASTMGVDTGDYTATFANSAGAIGANGSVTITGKDTSVKATDTTSQGTAIHGMTGVTITNKAAVEATSSSDIAGAAILAGGSQWIGAAVEITNGANVTATATSTSANETAQSFGGMGIAGSTVTVSESTLKVNSQAIGVTADVVNVSSGQITVSVEDSDNGTAIDASQGEIVVGSYNTPVDSDLISDNSVVVDNTVMKKDQLQDYTARIDKTYYTGEDGGNKAIADLANKQTVWLNADTTASRDDFELGNTVTIMLAAGVEYTGTIGGQGIRADVVKGHQEQLDGTLYTEYVYTMVVDNEEAEAKIIHADGTETYYKDAADALDGGYSDTLQAGDTVILLKDATITSSYMTIYEPITLDLNGKTLTLTKSNGLSFQYSASYSGDEKPVKMVIKDSSEGKTGKIVNNYSSGSYTGATVNVKQNVELTIESGIFEGKTTATGGTLILNGGTYCKEVVAGNVSPAVGTVIVTEEAVFDENCNVHANGGILILPGEAIGGDISKTAGTDNVAWKLLNANDELASADDVTAGNCKLVIYGQGAMKDFDSSSSKNAPWIGYNDAITEIVIEDGVTNIGKYAFYNMNGYDLTIGNDVATIGGSAFNFNFNSQYNAIGTVTISKGMTANLNAGLNPPIKSKTTTFEKVVVEEGNEKYSTDENGSVLYYKDDEGAIHLMKACTSIAANYVILDDTVKIYSGAFDNVLFESVKVPSSFGSDSFTFEKPIVIPDDMVLGDYAYYNNAALSASGGGQKGADEYKITPEDTRQDGFTIYMALGYKVTYNTGSDTITAVVPASKTIADFAPAIVADGKELKGWSATVNGTENVSNTKPTAAMTVYAIWETDEGFTPSYSNEIELENIPAQIYTGEELKPAVYYIDSEGTRKQVAESAVTYTSNINAGTATVYVKISDTESKTATFTINKAQFDPREYSFTGATRVDYDGQLHSLTIADLPEGITATYTYDGEEADGVKDVTYYTSGGVKSYTVKASFELGNNYEYVSGLNNSYKTKTGYLTINPLEVTITADSTTMYVDEEMPELTYTVKGLSEDMDLTTEPTLTTSATGKFVGNFPITASGAVVNNDANNYNITYETGYLTVGMKGISFANKTVSYNGENQTIALTVEGEMPENIYVTYTLNGEPFTGATDAGVYEVTATITSSDPTYSAVEPMTATLTIKPANVTIKADNQKIYIGDEIPALTYTVTGLVSGDSLTEQPELSCEADTSVVGTYDIVVEGGAAGSNYTVSTENGTLTVAKRTSSSSSSGGFSGVYNYPVNTSATGADVTLSDNYAVAGETVTITVDPDMGKQVDEVIVTDEDGDIIPVTKVGDNKYTFTMPAGKVNVAVTTEDADYDQRIVMQINNKNIVVNNKTITNDVSPVIVGDRTLVPVRIVIELLGGTADWDEATRTVTLTIDGKVLKLVIDEEIPGYGTGATIINNRTYVPIRWIIENLNGNVEWIAATQQIVIEK